MSLTPSQKEANPTERSRARTLASGAAFRAAQQQGRGSSCVVSPMAAPGRGRPTEPAPLSVLSCRGIEAGQALRPAAPGSACAKHQRQKKQTETKGPRPGPVCPAHGGPAARGFAPSIVVSHRVQAKVLSHKPGGGRRGRKRPCPRPAPGPGSGGPPHWLSRQQSRGRVVEKGGTKQTVSCRGRTIWQRRGNPQQDRPSPPTRPGRGGGGGTERARAQEHPAQTRRVPLRWACVTRGFFCPRQLWK